MEMLGLLAIPFVEITPESVVNRLVKNALAEQKKGAVTVALIAPDDISVLDSDHPGSLTHTKVLAATIDGQPMYKANWNGILDRLHVLGRERLGSFAALRAASGANLKDEKYTNDGYRYLPEINVSIQGVDSNLAWSHSLGLARALDVPIEVKFMWRQKEGAARPGETAVLRWAPKP